MRHKMGLLISLSCALCLGACTRGQAVLSPAERGEQEQRMRMFLEDSSPRSMNVQPRVTPEFSKSFSLKPRPKAAAPEMVAETAGDTAPT